MRLVRSAPNGSCLFISLRLGLECLTLLQHIKEGRVVKGLVNGYHPAVLKSSEDLRNDIIIKWFLHGLDKPIPGFGHFDEAKKTLWTRGDILLVEAHNIEELNEPMAVVRPKTSGGASGGATEHQDVCSVTEEPTTDERTANEKRATQMKYLSFMQSSPGRRPWGGQAEYTAFALIAKLTIEVYVFGLENGKRILVKYNEVKSPESTGTISLMFTGRNHYDLLLTDDDFLALQKVVPDIQCLRIM